MRVSRQASNRIGNYRGYTEGVTAHGWAFAGWIGRWMIAAALLAPQTYAAAYRRVSSTPVPSCRNIDSLASSRDGHWSASVARGTEEGISVQIWKDGALQHNLPLPSGLYSAAFSPDGTVLALTDRSNSKNGIYLLDPATGATRTKLEADWPISAFIFTPDGNRLIASPLGPATGLWIWRVGDWRREDVPLDSKLGKYQESLNFLPDGTLAISYADAIEGIWDFRTGQLKRRLSARDGLSSDVMAGPAAVSGDGKLLALGYTPVPDVPAYLPSSWWIRVWDPRTGNMSANLHPDREFAMLTFHPSSTLLAVQFSGTNDVQLFETAAWKLQEAVRGSGSIDTLAFGSNGDLILGGPASGTSCRIEVWRNQ